MSESDEVLEPVLAEVAMAPSLFRRGQLCRNAAAAGDPSGLPTVAPARPRILDDWLDSKGDGVNAEGSLPTLSTT